jgi:glycosyltransferase involved in cell wall biosynthesis
MNKIDLSIFFPAFNEERNIAKTIYNTLNTIDKIDQIKKFELIIVNDGSTDKTLEITNTIKASDNRIKIVSHGKNEGYGTALCTGIKNCKYEYIFFTDADQQFDISEIGKLLEFVPEYETIIGYRKNRNDNIIRKINTKSWNTLIRILFGLKVRDIDCAFKLIKKDVLDRMEIICKGAMISSEILIKIKDLGIPIKEVPVTHYPRINGNATGAKLGVILRAFKELFSVYRSYKK